MPENGPTLAQLLLDRFGRTPALPAMHHERDGTWEQITWGEAGGVAKEIAAGLISLGIEPRDPVALLAKNRPEWHLADWGTILAGALPVPIYTSNSPEQVAYVAGHSGSRIAFVEDRDQLEKVLKGFDELPLLRLVVLMDGDEEDDRVMTWRHLLEAGRAYTQSHPGEVDARAAAVRPEDLATIVYTSGTTGPPKGAMITHRNAVWTIGSATKVIILREGQERVLSYLPLAHIFERLVSDWGSIWAGADVWFARSLETLADDLRTVRPTFFVGVPRVYEKFHTKMRAGIAEHPKRSLIERAIAIGREIDDRMQAGRSVGFGLRARQALFDRLILGKLRAQIGLDQARFAVSAAAPINPELIRFVRAIGIEMIEAYGMTETTAPIAVNPIGGSRIGTVGPPIPGVEVRTAPDGEILVRGPNVFAGYLKNEDATRDTISEDGWLRTGDVGSIDEAGYVVVTDRKKDLIITAGGKNIAPQVIEERLKFHPLISQAVVIGDRRPYLAALLTPDVEAMAAWARENGIGFSVPAELVANDIVLAEVRRGVEEVNKLVSSVEQVKRWTLLDHDFLQEADELTPTIKVKRANVNKRYADAIEGLYG